MEENTTNIGSALSKSCPKRGTIWLKTYGNEIYVMPTNCKAWGCTSCRDRKKALIVNTIRYGILALETSHLVTLTLRLTEQRLKLLQEKSAGATAVNKQFKAWLRLLKSDGWELKWIKVPEMTKKGMIHLHLIIGGLTGKDKCRRFKKETDWLIPHCQCLQHQLSYKWHSVTKDSPIVDCTQLKGPLRSARYLAKYLMKGGNVRRALEFHGYTRRFSASRNFPRGGQLMLKGTKYKQWATRFWEPGAHFTDYINPNGEWGQQIGDNISQYLATDARIQRTLGVIKQYEQNHHGTNGPQSH